MTTIDVLAWQVLRVIFFMQFLVVNLAIELLQMMGAELSREQTIDLMGAAYSSAMMYQSPRPDILPGPIQEKIKPIGRFVLLVWVVSMVQGALLKIL